jgi:urease accessory protein
MIKVTEILEQPVDCKAKVVLPFELRQKSRLRTALQDGREIGLMLPRGSVLRGGQCLRAEDGTVILVEAALESVSTAFSKNSTLLARACYHLGNRHVPLQIGDTWLRYQHDHVLDQMIEGMGLRVFTEMAPFEPEGGAYDTQAHHHEHDHDHEHGHHHH